MGKIIGFVGAAGSGKTTAANYLVKRGPHLTPRVELRRMNFARPLKDMIAALAYACGLDRSQAGKLVNDPVLKEQESPHLGGFTPRFLMQSLGTEWGRDAVHPDFWVRIQMTKVNTALGRGYGVVYDDVRFDNEAGFIRALGGAVVGLKGRAGETATGWHRSETETPEPDFWVDNAGSAEDLNAQLERVITDYLQE